MSTDISHIEEALAHQERHIQDLNEVVTALWSEIERLKKQLARMGEKMNEIELTAKENNADGLSVTQEAALHKPPHY